MTKVDLEKLKIETNTNESIVSFKIKFVGKPTVSVKGNSLNSKAITNLKDSKHGDYLQIIDLKTESQSIKTFVLIQIVDKNELPPPPPPPVPENATPEQKERMKKAHEEYKHKKSTVESKEEMSVIPPPPPPIPADATPEQKEKYKKTSEEYYKKYKVENGKVSVKKPLAPKPPKSPLDHVVEMAKKNATFYYDGEKISSDKAINLLKQDTELSISTKNSDAKNPIVSITTNPVITDKNGKVITDIETLSEVEKNTRKDKVGYVRINEKVYYYSIKNKQISYFNRWGERVDKHGKPIKPN